MTNTTPAAYTIYTSPAATADFTPYNTDPFDTLAAAVVAVATDVVPDLDVTALTDPVADTDFRAWTAVTPDGPLTITIVRAA